MPLTLARPSAALAPSYFTFIDELRAAGDTVWPSRVPAAGESEGAFLNKLLRKEHQIEPPSPVCEAVFWGVDGGDTVVGVIALRLALTPALQHFGGHVGYEVRPSRRRQGVATAMLRALLATPQAQRIGRLFITCAPTNTGSRRAIEACGGVLEGVVFVESVSRETCHYWVATSGAGSSTPS